ncbi:MAG: DMT family transporter [Bacillota bacterium]|nr:DMT family transporter [Bacillota bacterium]MDW7684417.1 DMT family transporter [Bacillota bacterium]
MEKKPPRFAADLSLLLVALVWGLTFVSVKNALAEIAPFSFNLYRFTLAAMLLFAMAPRRVLRLKKETVLAGLVLGLFLFGGYSLQTIGLLYTTASNAGFLTGLVVVLVPLLLAIQTRKSPPVSAWAGALSAFAGVALLSLQTSLQLNPGDVLVIFCAVCFALQVIFVGRYCHDHDIIQLVFLQLAAVALLSGAGAMLTEKVLLPHSFTANIWQALFITAVLATTFAFFVQATMQKYTTPTRTAVVLSAEPVFAAFFAAVLLGEILGERILLGGGLIVLGMLIAESSVFSWPCSQKLFAKRGG